jgi:hypothetical protein
MSEIPSIHEALLAVMLEVTHIRKGSRHDFHKFMFRGVEQVMDHVGPAFRRHGIIPLPQVLDLQSRDVLTDKGKTMREVTLKVRYTLTGPAGDSYVVETYGEAQDAGGSAVSKAMAVAQRLAYVQALAIPTGESDPEAVNVQRASDPLLAVKVKIKAAADAKDWTMEQLAADYSEWSQGGDIAEADRLQLTEYLKVLQPPRKMQRRSNGGQP